MDLHIDKYIVFDKNTSAVLPFSAVLVDPRSQQSIDAIFTEPIPLPVYVPPHTRCLLSTTEVLDVPEGAAGFVTLRSTFARLGFISPPTVADPGFRGQLTMELFNASNHKIHLQPNEKVWSVILVQLVPGYEDMYKGRYQVQKGLTLPKALEPIDPLPSRGAYRQDPKESISIPRTRADLPGGGLDVRR